MVPGRGHKRSQADLTISLFASSRKGCGTIVDMGTGLLQPTHLIFLLILALLLFGAKRLPEIGRSLGVGMREFKDSVTGVQEATKIDTSRSELPPPQPTQAAPAAEPAPAPVAAPAPAPAAEEAPAPAAAPEQETEPVS
jgi:sec-independent protein translocase protein TatA